MKTTRCFAVPIWLPMEIWWKVKKTIAFPEGVYYTLSMANQGAADKVHLTMRIPIVLRKRLQRLAKKRGETLTDVVLSILQKAVKDVDLSPADFREVAAEVAENAARIRASLQPAPRKAPARKTVAKKAPAKKAAVKAPKATTAPKSPGATKTAKPATKSTTKAKPKTKKGGKA